MTALYLIVNALVVYIENYIRQQIELSTIFLRGEKMNQDVKRKAAGAGVRLWQVADAMGIADCSLSRKLRKELPQSEKERIFAIIDRLSQEVG